MAFNFESTAMTRRLPIYLLLDTSSSMGGAPIQAVNQGVALIYNELMGTPQALETAWVSVITFDSSARQVTPLTEISQFACPNLQANGSTSLGDAFDVLGHALDREVNTNSGERKGDYKPLIFILTDGEPTDDWRAAHQRLRSRISRKPATIIAVGCGAGANPSNIQQIGDLALMLSDATPDAINAFFRWVSQSVQVASIKAANSGGAGGQLTMPAPPPQVMNITI